MVVRRGEHLVAAFLCSQDWHPVISDADGYDILVTRAPHILRLQVKRTLEPQKDNERFNRRSWKWAVGIGRRKDILIPTDYYDVLALVALEPNVIQFVNAKDVNKKTYRNKPNSLSDRTAEDTWKDVVAKL